MIMSSSREKLERPPASESVEHVGGCQGHILALYGTVDNVDFLFIRLGPKRLDVEVPAPQKCRPRAPSCDARNKFLC